MPLRIAGADGSIRWAYHLAASIRPWTVTKDEGEDVYRLAGTIVQSHPVKVAQRPLTFVAPVKGGTWRWPILELQITGTSLTATLGHKEK